MSIARYGMHKAVRGGATNDREYKMCRPSRSWNPRVHFDPDSDRVGIFGDRIEQLAAIYGYYQQRDERIGGVTASCQHCEFFEATVGREGKVYHVKLRISEDGVYEYGREESL